MYPVVYTPARFAELLGISSKELLEKELRGIVPPARRNGKVRYYLPEDLSRYRTYLKIPSPIKSHRRQLFLNFKGGTGKSSLSASYGFRLAEMGIHTLLVDLDPQGHLTQCLGYDSHDGKTLYNALILKEDIRDIIMKTILPTLDLLPSNLSLSPIELALQPLNAREFRLKKALKPIEKDYEVIVMDASPSMGLLNLNAILAANDLIIPVLADFLSYHGLKILFETLATVEEDFSFTFDNIYILLNRYNRSHKICRRSREALIKHYSKYLLKTTIGQDTKIAEASSDGKTIFEYAPNSRGAVDIQRVIGEIFKIRNLTGKRFSKHKKGMPSKAKSRLFANYAQRR
ncbi:MAG TPA: ParA family protein [Syntrophaceae bacterium]|nr:ParA family protein [Syntrophaceae bacterium]